MDGDHAGFWSTVPVKAEHPTRVMILEALLWIGEPLSAVQLVDMLDGDVSMWEAAHHLRALQALDVVEPTEIDTGGELPRDDGFDMPYWLISPKGSNDEH